MIASVMRIAAETAEQTRDLPMPPWAYGVLALVSFAVLLGITFAFRSVGVHH